jgi:hypothetical protein
MQWIPNDTRVPITGQFMLKPDALVKIESGPVVDPEPKTSDLSFAARKRMPILPPTPAVVPVAVIVPAAVTKTPPPSFAVRHDLTSTRRQ